MAKYRKSARSRNTTLAGGAGGCLFVLIAIGLGLALLPYLGAIALGAFMFIGMLRVLGGSIPRT
jgi:hypothetical protein